MIYGRRPRQLIVVWVVSAALISLLFWFETSAPAFHELVLPFYWIIIAGAIVLTWRWLRSRSRTDRRGKDRRRTDRREDGNGSAGPQQ
jgi:peptidoglycan/LPS O-acetylase OafA/YrhL